MYHLEIKVNYYLGKNFNIFVKRDKCTCFCYKCFFSLIKLNANVTINDSIYKKKLKTSIYTIFTLKNIPYYNKTKSISSSCEKPTV